MVAQARVLDDVLHLLVQRQLGDLGGEPVDQREESAQRAGGARRQASAISAWPASPEAAVVVARVVAQEIERRAADAARRQVDDALEGDVVVARLREAQVRRARP